jgi:hypothetical protein
MRKVASRDACLACLLGGVCLLAGCAMLSQYDQGKAAARAEVEDARRVFGPDAELKVAASLLDPDHQRKSKSAEWRKGYEEAIREELKGAPALPH